jgi:glycosyltransferase involved in cell wall biosynthesis
VPRTQKKSVGVLVDLALTPTSGGHVRFWRNIAEAAAAEGCEFDISFHFQTPASTRASFTQLAEGVRLVCLPPVFSTGRLRFLDQGPDDADLAPHHPGLARHLKEYDVIHTTDAYFAYAKTALRTQDRLRQSLVTSIHSDIPAYTRIYSERIYLSLLGNGNLAQRAVGRWRWPERAEKRMRAHLARHLKRCDQVWLAPSDSVKNLAEPEKRENRSFLQRGLDRQIFSPDRRDRQGLLTEFDIPPKAFVLIFSGRIDIGKEVMVAAEATRILLDQGESVVLLMAGIGRDSEKIRSLLGPAVRLPGFVEQEKLGMMLASSDAFVFPSRIETAANAVIEARSAGLPVLVSPPIADMWVREDTVDGITVSEQTPEAWAAAIEILLRNPDRARKIGSLASAAIADSQPSWHDVLTRELVPGWQRSLGKLALGH